MNGDLIPSYNSPGGLVFIYLRLFSIIFWYFVLYFIIRWLGMYSRLDELLECRAVCCKNNRVVILDLTYDELLPRWKCLYLRFSVV